MQSRHHRADRDAEHLRDLLIGEALDVEQDGGAELLRQLLERVGHFGIDHLVQQLCLGIRR